MTGTIKYEGHDITHAISLDGMRQLLKMKKDKKLNDDYVEIISGEGKKVKIEWKKSVNHTLKLYLIFLQKATAEADMAQNRYREALEIAASLGLENG